VGRNAETMAGGHAGLILHRVAIRFSDPAAPARRDDSSTPTKADRIPSGDRLNVVPSIYWENPGPKASRA